MEKKFFSNPDTKVHTPAGLHTCRRVAGRPNAFRRRAQGAIRTRTARIVGKGDLRWQAHKGGRETCRGRSRGAGASLRRRDQDETPTRSHYKEDYEPARRLSDCRPRVFFFPGNETRPPSTLIAWPRGRDGFADRRSRRCPALPVAEIAPLSSRPVSQRWRRGQSAAGSPGGRPREGSSRWRKYAMMVANNRPAEIELLA